MRPGSTGNATAWRFTQLAAAMTIIGLMMNGCAPSREHADWITFSEEDAVGSWCGPPGDVLAVEADGSFHVSPLTTELYELLITRRHMSDYPHLEGLDPESASGTWSIREGGGVRRLHISIRKFDDELAGFGTEFFATRRKADDVDTLLYYASDPDSGFDYELTRCNTP